MDERRKNKRIKCSLKTVVKRTLPDRRTLVIEFVTSSLSCGGAFVSSEDLSLFDLGEEIHVMIEDGEDAFYDGKARVVRSARLFTEDKKVAQSGFGLMFIDPPPECLELIHHHVEKHIIL